MNNNLIVTFQNAGNFQKKQLKLKANQIIFLLHIY